MKQTNSRQRCEDILLESRQREYMLAETRLEIEQLRESLKWQHENNDVTKSCTARGDHLLTLPQNVVQELLTDRDALLTTIQTQNCEYSTDIETLNCKLSLVCQQVLAVTGEVHDLKRCNKMKEIVTAFVL